MKKILIVESDRIFEGNQVDPKKILIKKNKTIIKDVSYFNKDFYDSLIAKNITFKKMVEEWEIYNDQKVQIVCTAFGGKLRPVHIISNNQPTQGAKALFQSEKITLLNLIDERVSITIHTIDDRDNITKEVIHESNYQTYDDIFSAIPENFKSVILAIQGFQNRNSPNYERPIWCS